MMNTPSSVTQEWPVESEIIPPSYSMSYKSVICQSCTTANRSNLPLQRKMQIFSDICSLHWQFQMIAALIGICKSSSFSSQCIFSACKISRNVAMSQALLRFLLRRDTDKIFSQLSGSNRGRVSPHGPSSIFLICLPPPPSLHPRPAPTPTPPPPRPPTSPSCSKKPWSQLIRSCSRLFFFLLLLLLVQRAQISRRSAPFCNHGNTLEHNMLASRPVKCGTVRAKMFLQKRKKHWCTCAHLESDSGLVLDFEWVR